MANNFSLITNTTLTITFRYTENNVTQSATGWDAIEQRFSLSVLYRTVQ
jgi:hypothetical protein